VEEVSEVQAQLILNGRNSGFQEILPLYLLDDAGQIVESDDLTLTPGEVLVTVPIKQTSLVREVPVQASLLSETLTPGYEINSVLVDPRTVTLTGTSLALESVGEFVETAPISLTNVLSEVTLDSPLVFPEGVVAMDDLGDRIFSVSVHITVSPVNDYLLLKIEPTLLGVPPTYTVRLSPQEVSVLLEGPQPLLDEIKDDPALVIVTLDLEGFSPGLYMVPVDVQVPSGVTVEILPTEVQVTIEEVVEP
jgi:YbbR domain-containing protein